MGPTVLAEAALTKASRFGPLGLAAPPTSSPPLRVRRCSPGGHTP